MVGTSEPWEESEVVMAGNVKKPRGTPVITYGIALRGVTALCLGCLVETDRTLFIGHAGGGVINTETPLCGECANIVATVLGA